MLTKYLSRREKKKIRIKKKIFGTSERPRVSVYRSLTQIYAQVIDDTVGKTLFSASSLSKEIADDIKKAEGKVAKAAIVGEFLAKKIKEAGIESVVFDRSGYAYHGRVKALCEGIRKGGIKV
ncbi:MAG: 50S ribosomal protein L18 [Ignavibacteria bacterium]|nr:MAG: 50S ribosomal protein L18 [Ignavibacteria bacterium]